jgi:hypothetical protein
MSRVAKSKERLSKVSTNEGLLPSHQAVSISGMDSHIVINLRPSAASTALSNGDDLLFDLEPRNGFNIKDIVLRLRLTCATAAVTTVPGPYLIDRIRIEANKGSGDTLQTIYPEQIIWMYANMNQHEQEFYRNNGHFHLEECKKWYRFTKPLPLQVGDVKDVYIPIPGAFWHNQAIHLQQIKEDIRFRIELNSDFVVSGTATNVTVSDVSLLIRQDDQTSSESADWVSQGQSRPHVYNYLDVIKVTDNQTNQAVSTESKYDLDNVVGKVPFILCVHKPASSPAASDESLYNYYEIGDASTWDLKSPNNESLFGRGNGLRTDYLRLQWMNHVGRKPIHGMYMIPFTNDTDVSDAGMMDNYFPFVGDKETLSVTYTSAPTSEVHTFTTSDTADSGSYKMFYGGHYSAPIAYNGNAAAIKAAVELMPPIRDRHITVTASGAATSTFTLTYDAGSFRVSDDFKGEPMRLIESSLSDGTVGATFAETVSTYGKDGFVDQSYSVELFVFYFKRLMVSKDGRLSCKTL